MAPGVLEQSERDGLADVVLGGDLGRGQLEPTLGPIEHAQQTIEAGLRARCAEGDVHHIRDLIDEHPHTVYIRAADPRGVARQLLARDDVLSLRFEEGAVIVETGRPDAFYGRLTEIAASGEFGEITEVTSPDENLQAVFQYLVKT